ncbi:coactosin-like protein [Exaiptasia diaphana]|uniref:Coactosin-like protein n=1 Tax=Exaiptasia diaphana TaxID=2652724 RepID=A0A913YDU6_EXADI|nr:coactosin-like protein [Exaiptasia diaphana]
MPHNVDREGVENAYENVRNDTSKETWALFGYSDNEQIVHLKSGVDYCDFLGAFADDQRLYGFARIETGDEMSKRAKFVFITWIGDNVSPLKKAKVSTDKGNVKHYIMNFAIEVLTSDVNDLKYETLQSQVDKVGGAHYGTGK